MVKMVKTKKWKKSKYFGTDPRQVAIDKTKGAVLSGAGRWYVMNLPTFAGWLHEYLSGGTPITVIGDYDCDGVCSDSILDRIFRCYGRTDIEIVNPRRLTEGYGFSVKILDRLRNRSGVIITVDNGIRAVEAVAEAKRRGYVVMICDHHMPGKELPPADIIVDPHVENLVNMDGIEYDRKTLFEHYCAAGLVYRLACIMPGMRREALLQCAGFAAVATIADVVPLTGDNRNIWREGKTAIESGYMTEGLRRVIMSLGTNGMIDEGRVGFSISPPLNAPGRLLDNGADLSFALLSCDVPYTALSLFESISKLNEKRKILKAESIARADAAIEADADPDPNPIVVYDPETEPGIVGLTAGDLCERYERSSFVFTLENGNLKGSARGHELDDIHASLEECSEKNPGLIAGFGGHRKAAGVSLAKDKLEEFKKAMSEIMGPPHPVTDSLFYDMEIREEDSERVLSAFEELSPYGEECPKPVVLIRGMKLVKTGGKLFLAGRYGMVKFRGEHLEAIGFGFPAERQTDGNFSKEMDVIGTLSRNCYAGKCVPQLDMIDFRIRGKENAGDDGDEACAGETEMKRAVEVDNTVETAADEAPAACVSADVPVRENETKPAQTEEKKAAVPPEDSGADIPAGEGTDDETDIADILPGGMSFLDI